MRKRLVVFMLIYMLLSANIGFASPMQEEDKRFDLFFEQAIFFPVDIVDQVYINGTAYCISDLVTQKNGEVYVTMYMLEQLMGDQQLVLDGDNEEEGAEVLPPAPYTMVSLKDVCQQLGKYYGVYDGLVVISGQKQDLLAAYPEKLAIIKEQLLQSFKAENESVIFMENTESGILLRFEDQIVPLPGYETYWVYWSQNASEDQSQDDFNSEGFSTIVRKDLISGKTQQIAKVANKTDRRNSQLEEVIEVANGYLLRMFYYSSTVLGSYRTSFYVDSDQRVIPLVNDEIVDYCFIGDEMFYLTRGVHYQFRAPDPGELYQVHLENGTQQRIGQENINYRQMEKLDEDTLLLAAYTGDETATSYLYRLQLRDQKQVQLSQEAVMPMILQDKKSIFFVYLNDYILYCSAKDRLLYGMTKDGNERKLLSSQPVSTGVELRENCGYYMGDNGHLYQTRYDRAETRDISGCKIKQYVVVDEQVFFIGDGYQAGLYLWEKGEKKLLLSGKIRGIASDFLGRVVILPFETCAEYYVYEHGELRQASVV